MSSAPERCQIRPMTPADVEVVMAIALSLPHAPQWRGSAYQAALDPENRPQRIALVAWDAANVVAGFVVASFIPPDAELETIAVAARFQREGLARRLFRALSDELRLARVTNLVLEVRASNQPALALYRALGFAQAGIRPCYYADPVEDAILMSLNIE